MSVLEHISGSTRPYFTKYYEYVTYGRGSVPVALRYVLYTSGFTEVDVMLAQIARE